MPLLIWSDSYKINNEELDNHHKILFRIVNQLHDINVGVDKVNLFETIFDEIVEYIHYHLRAEEQYMKTTNYSGIDNHLLEHKQFADTITNVKKENNFGDYRLRCELVVSFSEMILHHVLQEDKKIAA
jgi:hemerythrin-like metal-binding protein